jgi:RimJ/RimL family protein N-acetyltransferase
VHSAIDFSPLFGLRLRTQRLELRLPTDDELVELAHLAEQGVHPPDEMPFQVAWTDAIGSPGFVEGFAAYHLGMRRDWRSDKWGLELSVWADGAPIGFQGLHGEDFSTKRRAITGSWLGQRHQRQGYGTEMRAAVLELAFSGLGAAVAVSGAAEGNIASQRVSGKLGYEKAGEKWVEPRGVPRREIVFALTRESWERSERPPIETVGLEPCLPLFGL